MCVSFKNLSTILYWLLEVFLSLREILEALRIWISILDSSVLSPGQIVTSLTPWLGLRNEILALVMLQLCDNVCDEHA